MHNHSNDNYINFKNRVHDPWLAFDGKVGLGHGSNFLRHDLWYKPKLGMHMIYGPKLS
jgi:hypothetical protein